MEGVTILASEVMTTLNPIGTTLLTIGFMFLIGTILITYFNSDIAVVAMTIGALLAFGGLFIGLSFEVPDYTKYDVILSEDVNFQEFYNHYEILEVKGQIYTVKEINPND